MRCVRDRFAFASLLLYKYYGMRRDVWKLKKGAQYPRLQSLPSGLHIYGLVQKTPADTNMTVGYDSGKPGGI